MITQIATAVMVGLFCWAYKAIKPPHPKMCGSKGGPPVTAPRVKLSDGRHLAYREMGVSKEDARHKIILIHGLDSSRNEFLPLSQEFMKELGLYILFFDRAGYGESDPNPKRFVKSEALDIEELADILELGSKFYVVGLSLGSFPVWSCLKYIPHRHVCVQGLLGAAVVAPHANYYWPLFPANLANQRFKKLPLRDQWTLRVARYTPWLFHWWMTQKLFPTLTVSRVGADILSRTDIEILKKFEEILGVSKQGRILQGVYVSLSQDMIAAHGKWEFDPMEITNPFPTNEGSVHMWQGGEDKIAPLPLNRYISEKLHWIRYHEIPDGGHFIFLEEKILKAIITHVLFG
ncbi:hypothetical protein RJ639_010286 [Escallonia herrerae]|uniref:AB hydrolase-1 domain-containing protein n=1 Tax=Escallonia herrerae TaxID=1293975 RepID=A0AA88VUB3_9ASTE|nr:hypothetical protein RJ639_010286 [Escallonia herrerae]